MQVHQDRMQEWRNGSGFQNLSLYKFVKMVKEMYSNMNFLKDDQTDATTTEMKAMIH